MVKCWHCGNIFRNGNSQKSGSLESHLARVKANKTIYRKASNRKYRQEHPNAPMVKKWINEH